MPGFDGKGASDASHDVDRETDQDDRAAAEAIAGRTIENLSGAEGDHEGDSVS